MNDSTPIKLSAATRAALRKAVTDNPQWADYRRDHALDISTMSGSQLQAAAIALGVDVATLPESAAPVAHVEVRAPVASNDAAQQLKELIETLAGNRAPIVDVNVSDLIDEKIAAAFKDITVNYSCTGFDGTTRAVSGHKHERFADLLLSATSRESDGFMSGIWLKGPRSTGKTTATKQIAQAMGLALHLNGPACGSHELLGFIDAGGRYHRTPFRECYEFGGVWTFDEADGSNNEAILPINSHLANGFGTFPDATIQRHPDSLFIATGNTWGSGATAQYSGRNKLDEAFLSRFPIKIEWLYDEALEVETSGDKQFARRVQNARANAARNGVQVAFDSRQMKAGAGLIANGATSDKAASLTYLAGLPADIIAKIEG